MSTQPEVFNQGTKGIDPYYLARKAIDSGTFEEDPTELYPDPTSKPKSIPMVHFVFSDKGADGKYGVVKYTNSHSVAEVHADQLREQGKLALFESYEHLHPGFGKFTATLFAKNPAAIENLWVGANDPAAK